MRKLKKRIGDFKETRGIAYQEIYLAMIMATR